MSTQNGVLRDIHAKLCVVLPIEVIPMGGEFRMSDDLDKRLAGIAESLELASRNIHETQDGLAEMRKRQEEYEKRQKELDRRERRGREAILAGIARYFQIMNEPEHE